ncbi:MAG: WbqC family protein [Elusimicrobia bacterium]|nr:WbqC family protein [Elusimicrobiota bacterium]
MFVTIHQPEFMPWAGFFNKIITTDQIVILDTVKFQKNYFDNRCRIKQGGKAQWLTVPVAHRDAGLPINQMEISPDVPWEKKSWHALYYNYHKAPHWKEHAPFLESFFSPGRWKKLVDLNRAFIAYVCESLGLPFKFRLASELKVESHGSQLVLDLCKAAGASRYLSGAFGKDYLDEGAFKAAGVELVFQDYSCPAYEQFDGPYVGPLSVVDMLLNQGPRSRELLGAS